jgi:D-beta-D-heptose 7-phosphate kinase/D-beta-D-heptose 1-phosphate adenosyltransferase
MTDLSAKRVARALRAARGLPVVVLGDVMLDEFVWGRVSRISPEAPVPVVEMERQSAHLGGAANVAHNLLTLGGAPHLLGVVGEDDAARRVREVLAEVGLSSAGLVSAADRPTIVKTRIIAQHQQVVRVDRERRGDISPEVEEEITARLRASLSGAKCLVLSDYSKGSLTPRLLTQAIALARQRRVPVLIDPKLKNLNCYRGATVVTPNVHEAELASGVAIDGPVGLEAAARTLLGRLRCRALLVTRGEEGMSLFERGRPPVHIRAAAREVFDVTGAGDTVIATMALGAAGGLSLEESARLANLAAGIVVGKLGTATVRPEEMLNALA